jgi:hypothetical protein
VADKPNEQGESIEATAKLTAYISTMFQQDLDNLILVIRGSKVQRRPTVTDRVHIRALGQQ